HFIGNVPASRLPEINAVLKSVTMNSEPLTLKLVRVAPGPSAKNPRLVWAVLAENKTFEKLVRQVTIGLGEKMEHQHPIPHITLARFSKNLYPIPKL
ncbi:hypothetical protein NL393_31925, partial [Klebsiella pneumoniae]|nr:hypothetical protein [Klebsiella pneumoniae]